MLTAVEPGWVARLDPSQAAAALDAARLIAARVTDPAVVADAVRSCADQTRYPLSVHWDAHSVAQGDAGQALLCAQLDACFPGAGWRQAAHQQLTRAVAGLQRRGGAGPGIFGGLSGLAFAAGRLGAGDDYRRLRATLDSEILAAALDQAAGLRGRTGLPVGAFDLISGLSGVAAYLLTAADSARVRFGLRTALDALAGLTAVEDGLPVWHTPAHLLHDEDQVRLYPHGNLNCGLAHGIPGPLAVLALAELQGAGTDRTADAIGELAYWLVAQQQDGAGGPDWPTVVPLVAAAGGAQPGPAREGSRTAWCYGTPGVARALWLAGAALSDRSLRDLAVRAMAGVYRRPVAARGIDSPTLCHGVAGLLLVTLRFAADTGLPLFRTAAADLVGQILARVDPDRPVAVATVEPAGNLVDQPGLLDGATGVALVLLAAATDTAPGWDRMLALA